MAVAVAAGHEPSRWRTATARGTDEKRMRGRQTPTVPGDATVVDAAGKWITPGIIDVHSHLGVYPSPSTASHSDGNEATAPVTAEVWAEHSVWPHDPGFPAALAGGVTSMQLLPGSANLIGGRSVTVKNVPGRNVMDMKFPGAPHGMKMACGENPKRVYGGRDQAPGTCQPDGNGRRIVFCFFVFLANPRQQDDLVVHRKAEHDREHDERQCRVRIAERGEQNPAIGIAAPVPQATP